MYDEQGQAMVRAVQSNYLALCDRPVYTRRAHPYRLHSSPKQFSMFYYNMWSFWNFNQVSTATCYFERELNFIRLVGLKTALCTVSQL
jgi:hypothetical protein